MASLRLRGAMESAAGLALPAAVGSSGACGLVRRLRLFRGRGLRRRLRRRLLLRGRRHRCADVLAQPRRAPPWSPPRAARSRTPPASTRARSARTGASRRPTLSVSPASGRGAACDALGVLADADRALLDGRARERDEGSAVVEGDEHPLGGACRLVEEDLVDRAQAVAVGREHVAARPGVEVLEVALRREIGHVPELPAWARSNPRQQAGFGSIAPHTGGQEPTPRRVIARPNGYR